MPMHGSQYLRTELKGLMHQSTIKQVWKYCNELVLL